MTRRATLIALASILVACTSASPGQSTAPPSSEPPTPSVAGSTGPPPSDAPPPSAEPPTETAWSRLAASVDGPGPREDHTWTLAPDGETAFLFGGRTGDGAALADLWSYDLAAGTWQELDAAGPTARFGHNAAWVQGVGLVIFAGQAGPTFFDDLWAFDPAAGTWERLPARGDRPVARYGSCAAVGPDGRLWISHGFTSDGVRFNDTRAYDFATGTWANETPQGDIPVPRCLHACWWTDDGALALYAGQTTGTTALADLWQLELGPRRGTHTWTQAPAGGLPPDRNLYAAARWGAGSVVFGGQAVDGGYRSDAWLLADDGSATALSPAGSAPGGRSGAELIADPSGERLLLFGGRDADGAMADLWELTLAAP